MLTNGSASTFYFTNEITDEVAKADGIDEITEQTYISSLAAACCDEKVQIIGFNPRYRLRDHPLDRIAVRRHAPARPDRCRSQHQRVGQQHGQTLWARIPRGGATRQYRHVARQFRVREHADRSRRGRIFRQGGTCRHSEEYADKAVSAVLIKVKDGYSAQQVASNITKTTGIKASDTCVREASQPQRNPI